MKFILTALAGCLCLLHPIHLTAQNPISDSLQAMILTPKESESPRINGTSMIGVRPNAPFFYHIPVTGKRPIAYTTVNLPKGLSLDAQTGNIAGKLTKEGSYVVQLKAKNKLGNSEKKLTIVVGETIGLTPAMGWNSWNCWGGSVNQDKVMRTAKAFAQFQLQEHGWSYINIDDGWQGARGGSNNALQTDPKKFPDIKAMTDSIHAMGLKVGIYSTPWVRSYAGRLGGSAENELGLKDSLFTKKVKYNAKQLPADIGKYSFAKQDAQQWADWGMDYLKYDWGPVTMPPTKEMYDALRATGRDIILSISNNAAGNLLKEINEVSPYAQSWRTTNDINDTWKNVSNIGFNQDKWAAAQSVGHFNDPDMLVIGYVGWGKPHPTKLTPDEQYAHFSLWCLLSSPLLLGFDAEKIDPFTLSLITNDEVIAIDQDVLCKQATKVSSKDSLELFAKPLSDGNVAIGLFNRSMHPAKVKAQWKDIGIEGKRTVRDLWRQKNIATADKEFEAEVASHGVVLVKLMK